MPKQSGQREMSGSFLGVDVFCLIEDEALRPESLGLIQSLREKGCAVEYCLTPMKPDKQFKRALESAAHYSVRLERQADGTHLARVKDLKSRSEELLPVEHAVQRLAKKG